LSPRTVVDGGAVPNEVVVLVTSGSQEESRRIARHLVEVKLAACVNITPPIESIYRWEGKVEEGQEYQLFIKTTRALFPEIQAAISKLHSYETPEMICLPIIDGARRYLAWLNDAVKPAPQEV
jgi:periplasmic divalent cation tolerance protein